MRYRIIGILKSIFAISLLALIGGCGDDPVSSVDSTGDTNQTAKSVELTAQTTGAITLKLAWKTGSSNTGSPTVPTGVVTVRVIASAADMTASIQKDFAATISNISITGVPTGSDRTLTIKALDKSGNVTHQGT